MKRFKFTLEALRTLREQEEQKSLREYSKALAAVTRASSRCEAAQKELEAAWAQFKDRLAGDAPVSDLTHLQAYCHAVETHLRDAEYAEQLARAKAREAFVELVETRHACAILDKLYDNQRRRYDRQRRRQEQKLLDDLANRPDLQHALPEISREGIWN